MIISNNWHTKQVDYTNSSSQEYLKEEFYIDPPRCFGGSDGISKVLRLITSLYGIRKAPRKFFDKLMSGLIGRLFIQSKLDPCLFIKYSTIYLLNVGNMILSDPEKHYT